MKKYKLGCILAYSAIFCAVGILATNTVIKVASADGEIEYWGHYSAVSPTMDNDGAREYWISCTTHEIRFEAPTGDNAVINPVDVPDINALRIANDYRFIPRYNAGSSMINFGVYPQTVVEDSDTLDALRNVIPDSEGRIIYNGNNYVPLEGNPYSGAKFDSESEIAAGTVYYFKVEPIKWNILSSNESNVSLVTNCIIDTHVYDSRSDSSQVSITAKNSYDGEDFSEQTESVYASNYKFSEIRKWLNEVFIENIDASIGDILTTEVDNSPSTTNDSSNTYTCDNTNDKVYLLSYQDYNNNNGFNDGASKYCKPTDYAKANYGYMSTNSGASYGNGIYWTRSPHSSYVNNAYYIGGTGNFNCHVTNYSYIGVRPALRLDVSNN